jgi:anti-sigma regulatory factor (Ser/Thr protein kinase)
MPQPNSLVPEPRTRAARSAVRLELNRDAEAPGTARALVDGWCPDLAGGPPRRETLILLVSEVVTNAVLHSRGPADAPIRVTANVREDRIHVAVTDAGEGFTPAVPGDPAAGDGPRIGGYGLYVLDRAASRWGVEEDEGTRVWFEL